MHDEDNGMYDVASGMYDVASGMYDVDCSSLRLIWFSFYLTLTHKTILFGSNFIHGSPISSFSIQFARNHTSHTCIDVFPLTN